MASIFLLAVMAIPAWSQLLFEENFDYPAGDSISAHGWVVHSGSTSGMPFIYVTSPGLTFSNYAGSGIGNAATLPGGATGNDFHHTFTAQTSGAVYLAVLVKVDGASTGGDYFIHLGPDPIGTTYKGRLFAKKDSSDNLAFGISNASTSTISYTGFDYTLGTTYLLVIRCEFGQNAKLFINPIIGQPEPAATATATDAISDPNNFGAVALRQGGSSTSPNVVVDGIRVATTWAGAVAGGGSSANQPPSISGLTRDPWVPSAEATVGATVTDDHNIVPPVRLIVSVDGVPTDSMDMSSTGSNTYEAEIPGKPNGSYVTYVIRATDDSGAVTITSPQKYFSGITNISTIRVNDGNGLNTYIGTPVRVRGIVTAGDTLFTGFNTDIFIQDATAGINVYKSGLTLYPDGRDLTVEGTINHFNGKLEITTPNITIFDNGPGTMPDPLIVAPADAFNEANEGKLMIITGVTFDASGNFATKDSAYTLNGNPAYLAFVDKDNDYLVGQPIPSGTVNLRGIMSQYDNSSPYTSGYQLLPRYVSDLNVVVAVNEPVSHLPKNFSIAQNFPNPFNPSTTIEYTVPKQSDISIKIYNLLGQEIRTLVNGSKAQGRYSVTWDGKDNAGRAVSTGIYFYRLNAPNFVETRKMVMIK